MSIFLAAGASWIEIMSVLGLVLGGLSGITIPFILYLLSKRNKEWDSVKGKISSVGERLDTLQKELIVLQATAANQAKEISDLWNHQDQDHQADQESVARAEQKIEALRTKIEEGQRDLYEKFVTSQQYQRDISAFEKYIALLRESIIQQTEIIERLK